jgi:hypothetical protein
VLLPTAPPPPTLQDLAVVVLLMLIPLLAPDPSGASTGMAQIAQALGLAAVKAVACIVGIIAGGRIFIRPLYKKISNLENAEIFAATTLLVVLGTSLMTQLAGEGGRTQEGGGKAGASCVGMWFLTTTTLRWGGLRPVRRRILYRQWFCSRRCNL